MESARARTAHDALRSAQHARTEAQRHTGQGARLHLHQHQRCPGSKELKLAHYLPPTPDKPPTRTDWGVTSIDIAVNMNTEEGFWWRNYSECPGRPEPEVTRRIKDSAQPWVPFAFEALAGSKAGSMEIRYVKAREIEAPVLTSWHQDLWEQPRGGSPRVKPA